MVRSFSGAELRGQQVHCMMSERRLRTKTGRAPHQPCDDVGEILQTKNSRCLVSHLSRREAVLEPNFASVAAPVMKLTYWTNIEENLWILARRVMNAFQEEYFHGFRGLKLFRVRVDRELYASGQSHSLEHDASLYYLFLVILPLRLGQKSNVTMWCNSLPYT
jgi:hypothetical protein